MKQQKAAQKQSKGSKAPIKEEHLIIYLTILLAFFYFFYSHLSNGFYQHDEAAHFNAMKGFWKNPHLILGTWQKTGFKLLYVLPSLLGETFMTFLNSVVAAFSAFLTYKIAKNYGSRFSILAFFLIALQPMWLQISFRTYAETTSALLFLLAIFTHQRKHYLLTALIISYLTLVRQEMYLFLALYGVYLLYNKNFRAVLVAAIPQVVITIWGYIANGNFLYILNSTILQDGQYSGAYPRHGIDHFAKFSEHIFGAIALTLFIGYIAIIIIKWKKPIWELLLPTLILFIMYSIFNIQDEDLSIPTAQNFRLLTQIAPLVACMGAFAVDEIQSFPKKQYLLIFFVPLAIAIGMFMTYKVNGIHFSDERNWVPLVFTLMTAFVLFLPLKKMNRTLITTVFVLFSVIYTKAEVKPYPLSPEDKTMKEVARWFELQMSRTTDNSPINEKKQLFAQHPLFFYYLDKTKYEFPKIVESIDKEGLEKEEKGSVILWDSHYSYRPKLKASSLNSSYFQNRPHEYKQIKRFVSSDNKFKVKVFVKTAAKDRFFEQGMKKYENKKYKEAVQLFTQSVRKNPKNHAAYLYLGRCHENMKKYNEAYQYYSQAIKTNSNYAEAYFERGKLLSGFKKFKQAENNFKQCLKIEPNNIKANYYLGHMFVRQKKYQQAVSYLSKTIKLNQQFPDAHYYLGVCFYNLNRRKQAKVSLSNASKLGSQKAKQFLNKNF
jgi:tetratricopeptide (TPR) repeat protein